MRTSRSKYLRSKGRAEPSTMKLVSPGPTLPWQLAPMTAAPKPSPHARNNRTSERARAIIATALLAIGLGAGLLATTTDAPTLLFRRAPMANGSAPSRIGKIVLDSSAESCRQLSFDNDTGRIYPDDSPCEGNVPRDATGNPVPVGTLQRLEAISKAFNR